MELIHADNGLVQIGFIQSFEQYDAIAGLGEKYADNDFELSLSEIEWDTYGIVIGDYIFEQGTEWGGRVEDIRHVGTTVYCGGPTWRGMLARKIVCPPSGQAYFTITSLDANAAIGQLVGTAMGSLFTVSAAVSGVTVSGAFRYTNLLAALHNMLIQYGARLEVTFNGTVVTLAAKSVVDYTSTVQFDQDYAAPLESALKHGRAYNHVIALGTGQLIDRTIVELWRTDAGTVTSTPQATGLDDKQFVFDYPNAESAEELTNSAVAALLNNSPVQEIKIDLTEISATLELGDVVGGNDRITNMSLAQPVTQKILTIDAEGKKINYKAGE